VLTIDFQQHAPRYRFLVSCSELLRFAFVSSGHNLGAISGHNKAVDLCDHFRVHLTMGRWKRFGVIVVRYSTDHDPPHVHVFHDGARVFKFDIESWIVVEGRMTAKAR
jgi:hypothetical protein